MSDSGITQSKILPFIDKLALPVILLLAFCLRFYRLDFQSFWLDELFTVIECDPGVSWSTTLEMVMRSENKSPVYFFIVKAFLVLFGSSEFSARSISAIAGLLSVYGMFLLGREMNGKRTGLIAAFLTSFNYFHLSQSQEARGYSLLFLFTVLSYYFFIRYLKSPSTRMALLYSVCTLLMLHFHHFAFLCLLSQLVIFIAFLFSHWNQAMILVKGFLLATVCIFAGYFPMIGSLLKSSGSKDSWMSVPEPDFFEQYFYEFFGNSSYQKAFLLICVLIFAVKLIPSLIPKNSRFFPGNDRFTFLLVLSGLIIMYWVPYLFTVQVTPILVLRYEIVSLPFLLLIVAIGFEKMSGDLRTVSLIAFFLLSWSNLNADKKYYTRHFKSQFRHTAKIISEYSETPYLIVNELTGWLQKYYLDKFGAKNPTVEMRKWRAADSLLLVAKRDSTFPGFWMSGGHQDPPPYDSTVAKLSTYFVSACTIDLYDAWLRLFIPAKKFENALNVDQRYFSNEDKFFENHDTLIAVRKSNAVRSLPVTLPAGKYSLRLVGYGQAARRTFPELALFINGVEANRLNTAKQMNYSPQSHFTSTGKPFTAELRIENNMPENQGNNDGTAFFSRLIFVRD